MEVEEREITKCTRERGVRRREECRGGGENMCTKKFHFRCVRESKRVKKDILCKDVLCDIIYFRRVK